MNYGQGARLIDKLKCDLKSAHLTSRNFNNITLLKFILLSPKFRIILRIRLACHFYKKGLIRNSISYLMYNLNLRYGIDIHRGARIGEGIRIPHPSNITIGEDSILGRNIRLMQGSTIGGNIGKKAIDPITGEMRTMPTILDNAIVGINSCILGPITVGRYSVIGAGTIVTRNVEDFSLFIRKDEYASIKLTSSNFLKFHYPIMCSEDILKEYQQAD